MLFEGGIYFQFTDEQTRRVSVTGLQRHSLRGTCPSGSANRKSHYYCHSQRSALVLPCFTRTMSFTLHCVLEPRSTHQAGFRNSWWVDGWKEEGRGGRRRPVRQALVAPQQPARCFGDCAPTICFIGFVVLQVGSHSRSCSDWCFLELCPSALLEPNLLWFLSQSVTQQSATVCRPCAQVLRCRIKRR